MVGCKNAGNPIKDGSNRRMLSDLPVDKAPHLPPVPPLGMFKICIERKIACGEGPSHKISSGSSKDWHVEDRHVEEIYGGIVFHYIFHGSAGGSPVFGRGSKEEIHIGPDTGILQVPENPGGCFQVNALLQGVENPLITRFQAQFQHDTPGVMQASTEYRVCQLFRNPDKTIPWHPFPLPGKGGQQGGADGVVEEMDQAGVRFFLETLQIGQDFFYR